MPAVTVDVTNWASKARLRCPDPRAHSGWRADGSSFWCPSCNKAYDELVDAKTGERVAREDVRLEGAG